MHKLYMQGYADSVFSSTVYETSIDLCSINSFFFFSYVNRPNTATVGIYAL